MLLVILLSTVINGWAGRATHLLPLFGSAAILPFIFFSTLVNTPEKHKILMLISIFAALVMVHNGIDQRYSIVEKSTFFSELVEPGVSWSGAKISIGDRITYLGFFNDPNDLGMFLVMVLPMALCFFVRSNKFLKYLWVTVVGFILYGILLTNSRGALLGVLSLCVVFGINKYGIRKMSYLMTFFLPIAFVAMSKFRAIDSKEESAAGRVDAWYEGFEMLKMNPLVGVGMNNFTEYHHLTAHNSFMLVIAELGILGFVSWFSFLLLTFYMASKIAFSKQPAVEEIDDKTKFRSKANLSRVALDQQTILESIQMRRNMRKGILSPKQQEKKQTRIDDEVMFAKTSFYSLLCFALTAFFLSRSYTPILYIYAGMAVACYYRALPFLPEVEPIDFFKTFFRLIGISLASIVFLYFVVKILL